MKKYLMSMLACIMAVMMGVEFASCSKEESVTPNPDPTPNPTPTIVGTWKYTFSSGYVLLTFKSDGTGLYQEYDHGYWEESGESFYYTYSGNTLTFRETTNPSKTETATVLSLTDKQLILKDWPDHGSCTFTKVGTPTTTPTIVGTWKYTFSSGYVLLTFKSDGTGLYQEYDHGYWEESGESFYYTYSGNTLTFRETTNPSKTETATVLSLTDKQLVLKDWPDGGSCTFVKQ